jgi:hypothetical protein
LIAAWFDGGDELDPGGEVAPPVGIGEQLQQRGAEFLGGSS